MLSPESGHSAVRARNLSEEGGRGQGPGMGKRSVREPEDGKREGGKRNLQGGAGKEQAKQEKNYTTLQNILQSKEAGANKNKAGTGNKGYRKKEAWTPMPPPNCVPQIDPSKVFFFLCNFRYWPWS